MVAAASVMSAGHDAHFYGHGDPNHEPSILQRIAAQRVEDAAHALSRTPESELRRMAEALDAELGGTLSLLSRMDEESPEMAVAAEFKRASPSKGDIATDLVAGEQAVKYARAGAAVLSVLTEPKWFKGSLEDMLEVRRATQALPRDGGRSRPAILRKDFIVNEYMVLEARAFGADTVLLIVAILEVDKLKRLIDFCRKEGMEPLVEVHTDREMEIALEAGSRVIGVNNRNLHTFKLDLGTTERVAKVAARMGYSWGSQGGIRLAALSGIASPSDVQRFRDADVSMVLIGETLMRAADPGAAIATLLGRTSAGSIGQLTKVCGITNVSDALVAVRAGANLIGVIFAPKSKRVVTIEQAKEVVQAVRAFGERKEAKFLSAPQGWETSADWFTSWSQVLASSSQRTPLVVGVFQNHPLDEVRKIATEVGLDLVQLHGDEGMEACSQCGVPAIRVLHVPGEDQASTAQERASLMLKDEIKPGHAAAILLDTTIRGVQGGSGVQFDPQVARILAEDGGVPVIVAGGITPDNVSKVLSESQAWGLDCSSGVEISPGVKNHDAVKGYLAAAKSFSQ